MGQAREGFAPQLTAREVGTLLTVSAATAKVAGLPSAGFQELVKFRDDSLGVVFNVDPDELGIVLLGDCVSLHAGDEVLRTGRVMDVPVGDGLIGRVIDALGRADRRGRADCPQRPSAD